MNIECIRTMSEQFTSAIFPIEMRAQLYEIEISPLCYEIKLN